MASPDEKIEILRKSIEEEPDDPLGHYLLGVELRRLGRHQEASDAFRRAVDLAADYTAAYRELGKSLRDQGRVEEAVKAFADGLAVAERTHDIQTAKEIRVFLRRLRGEG